MEKKLGDIMTFCAVRNVTRENTGNVYSLDDFYADLDGRNPYADTGDEDVRCVVSLTKNKAAVLSPETQKKTLSSIFLMCIPDRTVIDPWYFCYLFNESAELATQMRRLQQGTIVCMAKLNTASISSLTVDLPPAEKQKTIGLAYREMLRQERLRLEQAQNMKQITLEVLKIMNEKTGGNDNGRK